MRHIKELQSNCLVLFLEYILNKANDYQVSGNYYKQFNIEVWDAILDWQLGYLEGNVVKYVARYKHKNGLQDLEKAAHYLQKLIETVKNGKE